MLLVDVGVLDYVAGVHYFLKCQLAMSILDVMAQEKQRLPGFNSWLISGRAWPFWLVGAWRWWL